ncbi:MAG: cytochrome c family protein [Hyphomicrobiales bacterium]|nr:cytochrome c family protein [Hyphomicrobiales bacterium]
MMNMEVNKMAGAVLGSLLAVMALGVFSDAIYAPDAMKKPGYDLPAAQEGGAEAAAKPAAPAQPLPVLLAKADAQKGQADTKPCTTCHSFDKGGAAKIGPPLYGVVGRPKGSVAGFGYSDGMKAKGGDWTFDDLNQFITSPKAYVSGTKMSYAGEADAEKRADIIAYLRTLSDNPVPLPAVAAAAPAAAPAAEKK